MAVRILVRFKEKAEDARARQLERRISAYLGIKASVERIDSYTIDAKLSEEEAKLAATKLFADPIVQEALIGSADGECDYLIEIGLLPGVKDNVGDTSKKALEELLGRELEGGVYASTQYRLSGGVARSDAERIASELLGNPMIQHWKVLACGESSGLPVPKVRIGGEGEIHAIPLSADDSGLVSISKKRSLALSLSDMKVVRAYYMQESVRKKRRLRGLPDWPTDAELEVIAQTQSEHCKHRIFNSLIRYSEGGRTKLIDSLFNSYIRKSAEEIAKERDWIVSMFWDNAGVAKLNGSWNYAVKCETHNSPSALDPYGGAITGIVGVYRDPMGTGKGSKIIAGTYGFATASPFYTGGLSPRMPPRRLLDGVVEGVKDGGNKSGVPTAYGFAFFDEGWLGKPLVYVSAIGLMPSSINGEPSHEKHVDSGDRVVMVGGRVGKDGIHGATESSLEGGEWITAGHVQIGDPFTQKKVQDFILEARDLGLYNAITDMGAGGISSAAGETARMSNGCTLELSRVPLKYSGLKPWEIIVSESQERMLLAVPPKKMGELQRLAKKHDVEATDIGVFEDTGEFAANWKGKPVLALDMGFLHSGFPQLELEAEWKGGGEPEPELPPEDQGALLHEMLSRENIASKEWIQRQYDHEVQGGSVIKPFLGKENDGPSDAAVIRPLLGEDVGIAIGAGFTPKYSKIDAYYMAAASLDEAIRRVISVGASLGHIALNDNFCWPDSIYDSKGNPDGKQKLAQLVRANKALYDYTTYFKTPCISGKDSMFIDGNIRGSDGKEHKVSGLPALLFTAYAKVNDVRKCVSMDFKDEGDAVYIIGDTNNELGASEYYEARGHVGGNVPMLDKEKALQGYRTAEKAIQEGLLKSCHGCYRGGLAVALASCAIAGGIGAKLSLNGLPGNAKSDIAKLYSETGGRFIVTVAGKDTARFEKLATQAKRIGTVGGDLLVVDGIISEPIKGLKQSWQSTFRGFW